ncbi:MAG: hypothetical protein ACFFD4_39580 [Candidatus Odinarchaeota archaeon]
MSSKYQITRALILVIILYAGFFLTLQCSSQGIGSSKTDDEEITIPYPGLVLEYSVLVTFREENSAILVPVPANLTICYHDYLNETIINSTLSLSSFLLSIYFNGTENGEIWENVTTRMVEEIILDQTVLLAIFYDTYHNKSAENFTPFWVFQRNWTIGEFFGAYNFNLEIKNIDTVTLQNYGTRTGIIAIVNRTVTINDTQYIQDNATLMYDLETGLLIKSEILNWNALYYDPPRIYTTRIELVRTNYEKLKSINSSTVPGNKTQIPLPPLFSVSRTSVAYVLLSIFIPAGIAVINFSRIKRIQGGDRKTR